MKRVYQQALKILENVPVVIVTLDGKCLETVIARTVGQRWKVRDDMKFIIDIPESEFKEKVKHVREEMKEHSYSLRCFNEDVFDEDERVVDLDDVLIILDKLIEEVLNYEIYN